MNKIFRLVLMICTLSVLLCSTCFAAEQVQMNDSLGAANVIAKYNRLVSSLSDMDDCIASEPYLGKQNQNYDVYGSQCKNNSILAFQCNKAGYVVYCAIVSPCRNTVIKETLAILYVITNYEEASYACKHAISASSVEGYTHVWYSDNMDRVS